MDEKPKRCPFCGARPHQGEGKVRHCQLHGEPFQDFYVWCPHLCARKSGGNRASAVKEWNKRPIDADALAALKEGRRALGVAVKHAGGDPETHIVCKQMAEAIAKLEAS